MESLIVIVFLIVICGGAMYAIQYSTLSAMLVYRSWINQMQKKLASFKQLRESSPILVEDENLQKLSLEFFQVFDRVMRGVVNVREKHGYQAVRIYLRDVVQYNEIDKKLGEISTALRNRIQPMKPFDADDNKDYMVEN